MNTVVVVCILILFLVKRNKLDTHSLTPKFIEKLELPFKGSYNIPKFHYAAIHYITAHIPLACCTVIYNFMNYKSVSFHHSWNILPDVQITLWKTTTSKSALTEQPYLPQMDCGKMRKQATKNFNVAWLTKSIAFTAPDKIPHQPQGATGVYLMHGRWRNHHCAWFSVSTVCSFTDNKLRLTVY